VPRRGPRAPARRARAVLASLALGWLLVDHQWIETSSRDSGSCSYHATWPGNKTPTLWSCFWTSEPGTPPYPDASETFLNSEWDPVKKPIPQEWIRGVGPGVLLPTDPG
jgi:hypothetical protein